MPDWLQGVDDDEAMPASKPDMDVVGSEPADMPDWLQDLTAEEDTSETLPEVEASVTRYA